MLQLNVTLSSRQDFEFQSKNLLTLKYQDAVKARFDAWNKLAAIENVFDETMLDDTKEEKTIKLLETAVLLMEGASEEDVKLINSGKLQIFIK